MFIIRRRGPRQHRPHIEAKTYVRVVQAGREVVMSGAIVRCVHVYGFGTRWCTEGVGVPIYSLCVF